MLTHYLFDNDTHVMKEGLMKSEDYEILNNSITGIQATAAQQGQMIDAIAGGLSAVRDRQDALEKQSAIQAGQIKKLFANDTDQRQLNERQVDINNQVQDLLTKVIGLIDPLKIPVNTTAVKDKFLRDISIDTKDWSEAKKEEPNG